MSQLLKNIEKGSTKEIELEEGFWVFIKFIMTLFSFIFA
jgi:hypothetical protein